MFSFQTSLTLKKSRYHYLLPSYSPGWGELHMGVKESRHLGGGDLPALDSGPDQSLSLLVPDDLHQAGVALVHILLQRTFQLLCSPKDEDNTKQNIV